MADSEQSSEQLPGSGLMQRVELCIVVLMATIAVAFVLAQVWWICTGGPWNEAHNRISEVIHLLNQNWKVGLLLLIPLFYRSIRAFLERVEEAFGMKAPQRPIPPAATSIAVNPDTKPEPKSEQEPTGESE